MKFKPYPKYKESGVGWLGEIPENWEVENSRRLFTLRKERADVGDRQLTASQKYGILFQDDYMVLEDQKVTMVFKNAEILKLVEPNDFVISMRSFQGGLELSNLHGSISSAYVMVVPSKSIIPSFYRWVFKSTTYIQALQSTSNLIRDGQALRYENFTMVPLMKIPEALQQTLANFLDTETTRIDSLVIDYEELISLLHEKRQALITHAVTRGISELVSKEDPEFGEWAKPVKFKDSGIEWLGEIPEGWEVKSIKWLSPVQRGASPRPIDDPKYFNENGQYAWVRISDVTSSETGFLQTTTEQLSELGASLSVKLEPGSLFISIAGTVGKPCITMIKACIHDGFVYFPLLKVNPRFFYRIFESGRCYGGLGKFGTQLNLNTDTIGSIRIALPPKDEIESLLAFLDKETAKMNTLISEAKSAVELLKEHRSALITNVVTGKINVEEMT